MQRFVSLVLALIAVPAIAAVTSEWQVNLKKGSSNQAPVAVGRTLEEAVAACQARIPATASATATYTCHNLRYVAVVTPDATCAPAPAPTTLPQNCPPPTTGTWTQTSTSTVGPPPACTVTTTWKPSSPPPGACTQPPPPECPPLPPPDTRPQPCPAGTSGSWTQTKTFSAAPYPTCSVAGEWSPPSPPAGACVPDAPPTGDTITNGQSFTIAGTNFGSKPQAAPVMFDDFEAGTLGAKVEGRPAAVGTWGRGEWSFNVTYDSVQPTQGSKVAKHSFGGGTYNASLYVNKTGNTFYLDYWHRVVPRSGTYSRNFKPWRIYGANDTSFANDVVFCDSPGWFGTDWGGGGWIQRPMVGQYPRAINVWEHYRVVVKSGPGGVISQHRDGIPDLERTTNASGTASEGVRIGHYWGLDGTNDGACPSNAGADVYTDLVYVDTSLARVYLADAATLAQAKHTAIQIPTIWADGAVTVEANTHGFAKGQAAHVIVIDAANVQRGSKQVTVQ